MRKYLLRLWGVALFIGLLCVVGCAQESATNGDSTTKTANKEVRDKDRPSFVKHTENEGPSIKQGDLLYFNFQYATPSDSVYYSNFEQGVPVSLVYDDRFFRGLLGKGLLELTAGDSATFRIPATSLYTNLLPYLKQGDDVRCDFKLVRISSQEEQIHSRQSLLRKRLKTDEANLQRIMKKRKSDWKEAVRDTFGIYKKILKEGEGEVLNDVDSYYVIYDLKQHARRTSTVASSEKDTVWVRAQKSLVGVQQALKGMRRGEKSRFMIPATLHFEPENISNLRCGSSLSYEVEVLEAR